MPLPSKEPWLFLAKVSTLSPRYLSILTSFGFSGRRGLLNLGQTCFLNVVLQSFAHNPLLRNYFLGDKHNRKQCKVENCTCCEMDKLFSEVGRGQIGRVHAVTELT